MLFRSECIQAFHVCFTADNESSAYEISKYEVSLFYYLYVWNVIVHLCVCYCFYEIISTKTHSKDTEKLINKFYDSLNKVSRFLKSDLNSNFGH